MAGFKYKPRSREQIENRKKATAGDFVGIFLNEVKVFTVKDNADHCLRILPPTWEDAEHYGLDAYIHYGVGPDRASVLCLNKHKNKPCPVCELRNKLSARGDDDEAKELKASKSVIMYVVDRDNEREGVMAWRAPFGVDADIVKLCVDSRSGETYNIDDPEEGYDVSFSTEGKQMQRKYKAIKLARRPTSVAKKFITYVEENPLPEVLNFLSYDEIEKLLAGGPSKKRRDDDDDDGDDRRPAKRKSRDDDDEDDHKPAKRRSARDDDDEEDERPVKRRRPADDDDDDDDEDDSPKTKRRRPADDDDEDEEEEKPKKRRSARAADDDEDPPFDGGKRVKRKADDDEDEEEDKPKKKRRPVEEDEDEEDEPPAKKKRRPADDDEDEEEEKPKSKVRERLAARKKRDDD